MATPNDSDAPRSGLLHAPPENFETFVIENALLLDRVYGPRAGQVYRERARLALTHQLHQPHVEVLGVLLGAACAAYAVLTLAHGTAEVTYMQVRDGQPPSVHHALLAAILARADHHACASIVGEVLIAPGMPWQTALEAFGWACVERYIMRVDLVHGPLWTTPVDAHALARQDYAEAAHLIAAAYQDHPDRAIHTHVRSLPQAERFVGQVVSGCFGTFVRPFATGVRDAQGLAAVALGVGAFPDTGFLVQVAVRADRQREGLGRTVTQALLRAFQAEGLEQAALAVSIDNPSRRLYQGFGFQKAADVTAFARWS